MSKLRPKKEPREPGASCSSHRFAQEDMAPIRMSRKRNNRRASV